MASAKFRRPVISCCLLLALTCSTGVARSEQADSSATADLSILRDRADALIQKEDWPLAELRLRQILARPDASAWDYAQLAYALEKQARFSEARPVLERSVQLWPQDHSTHSALCWHWLQQNQGLKALASCQTTAELAPTSGAARAQLGHSWLLQAEAAKAQAHYVEAILLFKDADPLEQGPLVDLDLFIQKGWQSDSASQARDWFARSWPLLREAEQASADFEQSRRAEALPLAEKAYRLRQQVLGDDHALTLGSMDSLADGYGDWGQDDKALQLKEQVLRLRQSKQGPEHPDSLVAMRRLADTHRLLEHNETARALMAQVLAQSQATLGPDHPDTIAAMTKLALALGNLGLYESERALLEQVVAWRSSHQGPQHTETLSAMHDLSDAYRRHGETAKALALAEEVVAAFTARFGADHTDSLHSISNLAKSLMAMGQYARALPMTQQVLASRQAIFGPEHSYTLNAMSQLASCLEAMGQAEKALALAEEVLSISQRTLGAQHETSRVRASHLATSYFLAGRHDKAQRMSEQNFVDARASLGPDHPSTLISMGNLAHIYGELGKFDQALALGEQQLSLARTKLGAAHPDTATALSNLASLFGALGQHDKALALNSQALELRQAKLGANHPDTLDSLNNLALIYERTGHPELALPLAQQVLAASQASMGADHPGTLTTMGNLASIQHSLGQFEQARSVAEQVLAARRRLLGPAHLDTLIAMGNLAVYCGDLGLFERARALSQEVLAARRSALGPLHPHTLTAMGNAAWALKKVGRGDAALALSSEWRHGAELLRSQAGLAPDLKRSMFAGYADTYQAWAFIHAEQDQALVGFDLADLSKARSLTDQLKAQSALRSLPPAEQAALLAVQAQALDRQQQLEVLQTQAKPEVGALLAAQAALQDGNAEHARLQAELKLRYPKYAQLSDLPPTSADQAPKLLAEGELFISYLVRQNGLAQVFMLDRSGAVRWLNLGFLPALSQTVAASRELISPSRRRSGQGQLLLLKGGGYQWLQPGQAPPAGAIVAADSVAAASALLNRYWQAKLIQPLLAVAADYPRWIISPDKDLALLPFDTLPELLEGADAAAPRLLAERRNLSLVQSFSVYALLKQRAAEYTQLPPRQALLAMGNAVYGEGWSESRGITRGSGDAAWRSSDAELAQGLIKPAAEQQLLRKLRWQNLPGTGREVEAVGDEFSQAGQHADRLLGSDASEARLLALNASGQLKDYRYLLFSAHGYLAQNPSLSALVLSQQGNPPQHDGYISAEEWPQYDLRSDLTVLSACDTGVGKTQAGESVMGLPYALFVAGNKNTLLSLWPVDDDATAEFMRSFFALLKDGIGQPEALARTKRAFMRSPEWSAPRYWAAFVLYGV